MILQELYEVDEVANNADVTYDDNAPLLRIKQVLLLILKQMEEEIE